MNTTLIKKAKKERENKLPNKVKIGGVNSKFYTKNYEEILMSGKHLYVVRLKQAAKKGQNTVKFRNNVQDNLKGIEPGYGGQGDTYLVSHHMDLETVHMLATDEIKKPEESVTVEEITSDTLKAEHIPYRSTIERYFLPHDTFLNIE